MSAQNGATTLFDYQVVILIFTGAGSAEQQSDAENFRGASPAFPNLLAQEIQTYLSVHASHQITPHLDIAVKAVQSGPWAAAAAVQLSLIHI